MSRSGAEEGAGKAVISWVHSARSPDGAVPTAVSSFSLQYCEVDTGNTSITVPEAGKNSNTCPWTRQRPVWLRIPKLVATGRGLACTGCAPLPAMIRFHLVIPTPLHRSVPATTTRLLDVSLPCLRQGMTQRETRGWKSAGIVLRAAENPVTGYELQIAPDADIPSTEDGWLTVDARIAAVAPPVCILYSGAVPNQVYWFRVRAYNDAGHGNWSAPYQYRHGEEFVPSHAPARASVQSGSALTVTDTRAREGSDAALVFEVTLDRAVSEPVMVDYATADGTATADEDYRATSGTLEIAAGETSKTIEVAVHADTKDEGEETLTLSLTNAVGARIEDGEATGTIQDKDPLPQAWLARFGRTVAGQAVDAVGTRLESERSPHARVGGMSIGSSSASGDPARR